MRVVLLGLLVAACSHTEPAPCSPADYATLSVECGDDTVECSRQIDERRALCERLIRDDQ